MMIRRMVFSRNNYFYGRLLTASDLEREQSYHHDKQQFRNLHTFGVGIVSGLSVTPQNGGRSIQISHGYAIDRLGREVCVPSDVDCPLPQKSDRLLVSIGYVETETEPTPVLPGKPSSKGNPVKYTRIEEGYEVTLSQIPPGKPVGSPCNRLTQSEPSALIPLAILQRKGKQWVVEPPPRRTPAKSARTKPPRGKNI